VAGVISIVIYTVTAVSLLQPLGLLSLMVADAVKHFVHTMIMLWLLQRHLNGLAGHGVTTAALKSLLAALITGLVAYGASQLAISFIPGAGFGFKLSVVAISGIVGLLAYAGMVFWLNIPEAKLVPQLLLRKKG
jgi:putative peptidoglycan lipid II flippase